MRWDLAYVGCVTVMRPCCRVKTSVVRRSLLPADYHIKTKLEESTTGLFYFGSRFRHLTCNDCEQVATELTATARISAAWRPCYMLLVIFDGHEDCRRPLPKGYRIRVPSKLLFPVGNVHGIIHGSLDPFECAPKWHLYRSAVCAGLAVVTNTHTQTQTDRPRQTHVLHCHVLLLGSSFSHPVFWTVFTSCILQVPSHLIQSIYPLL